ncbi:MAG: hypothetical protein K2Q33_01995 [Gammaproteobacteria bacterium]|nr:hypothetical protein [Gammaproteobacteria bacterium]
MQFNQDFIKFLSNYGTIIREDELYHYTPLTQNDLKENPGDLVVCPLLHWSWLKISGEDSKKFLQGQLTCDITSLTSHHGHLGAHCNRQGQVIATFYIYLRDGAYYLHLPKASAPLLQKSLQQYAKFSKVNLECVDEDLVSVGIAGKHSYKPLRQYIGMEPPLANQQCLYQEVYVHRVPGAVDRFVCSARLESMIPLWQTLMTHKATLANESIWAKYDIDHRLAHIRPQTSGLFTPHAIALPEHQGVSFTKGCYTGQEIVARMHYLGRGKRKLSYCSRPLELSYAPGDTLLDEHEKPLGIVVECYVDFAQKTQHLLAVLQ